MVISFEAALNVFALSDIILEDRPRLPVNCLNAIRKEVAVRSLVSSRWTAHVLPQVNKHVCFTRSFGDCTYSGPAKSTTIMVKSAWVLTRSFGSGEAGGMAMGSPSNLLHITHLHKTFFTVALPFTIQLVLHLMFLLHYCEGLVNAAVV